MVKTDRAVDLERWHTETCLAKTVLAEQNVCKIKQNMSKQN